MCILVTGAQGYLGSKVVEALIAKGEHVHKTGRRSSQNVWTCDLTQYDEVVQLVSHLQPEQIIHCAAFVPQTQQEYQDADATEVSLVMLRNVLQASSCPFIYISSMTVYDAATSRPKTELAVGHPTSAYGKGKLSGEEMLKNDGRPAFAVRLPGLFGPPRQNGLVANVVRSFKERQEISLPESPILWAAMLVEDAAQSIALLTDNKINQFCAVNVGYPGVYSISRFVQEVENIFGRSIDYDVGHPDFEFNLNKAAELGILPSRSFKQAIIEFGELL